MAYGYLPVYLPTTDVKKIIDKLKEQKKEELL